MPTPAKVVATFQRRIVISLALYDELVLAVDQKKKQKSLETMLAEQCVLGLAVLWEAFVHDLMIAYIEERCETCVRFYRDKVTQSIGAKSKIFAKWMKIKVPTSLNRNQIELMVDPDGWNITADSAETLAKTANQLLSAPHAIKFSLADTDRKFVDLLIAIRNFLSHRSSGALTIMKQRLEEIEAVDPASPLNGNVTTIGVYLKTQPSGAAENRAKLVGRHLIGLSSKLV